MENFNQPFMNSNNRNTAIPVARDNSKSLLAASFSWMALALVITTIFAALFGMVEQLAGYLIDIVPSAGGGLRAKLNILGWIVMFAPLGLVLLMSFRVQKMSFPMLVLCFIAYAAVNGISLFFIFMFYDIGKILNVFLSCTALFGVFAAAGYFTKTDLSKLGSILFIGLVGIIIASFINFFTNSSTMDYIISFAGVVIFTGLTAYDVQKIKNLGSRVDGGESMAKIAIMGALSLYLDFINLFLFLLRLFGGRD